MNINRINPVDKIDQVNTNQKVGQPAKTARAESINVSAEAREAAELLRIRDMILSTSDIREDKVAEIKLKLEDPNYLNNKLIDDVADKLIDFYRL